MNIRAKSKLKKEKKLALIDSYMQGCELRNWKGIDKEKVLKYAKKLKEEIENGPC